MVSLYGGLHCLSAFQCVLYLNYTWPAAATVPVSRQWLIVCNVVYLFLYCIAESPDGA